ncbi:hypothetical protein MKW92_000012 [Papaver armeniacum]|nr:hypothetical protein MKW92_000012 [Papaver armeniacum]
MAKMLLKMETFLFTSESVNEGHPDKLCDQISDAVLDACLEIGPLTARLLVKLVPRQTWLWFSERLQLKPMLITRRLFVILAVLSVFDSIYVGLDADNCKVLVNIEQQSPLIFSRAKVQFHTKRPEEIGAGDQGHMFGIHVLANKLGAKLTEVRKNDLSHCEYHNEAGAMVPLLVHTVPFPTQHDETDHDEIAADLMSIREDHLPPLTHQAAFHWWFLGGDAISSQKDHHSSHLRRRWGAHGGGAFLRKGSNQGGTGVSKGIVRQAAKSIAANGLARRCIVQVSYAIGVPEPYQKLFDFRPGMISIHLDLKRGGNSRFLKTAALRSLEETTLTSHGRLSSHSSGTKLKLRRKT